MISRLNHIKLLGELKIVIFVRKKYWNRSKIFCLQDFTSILCRHPHKGLRPGLHDAPYGTLLSLYMESLCCIHIGCSHWILQSNFWSELMSWSARSYVGCRIWGTWLRSFRIVWLEAQGYHGTWNKGIRCTFFELLEVSVLDGVNEFILECFIVLMLQLI